MRASVIVLGTPTYDAFPFPKIWAFVNEMKGKRYAQRAIALFGTFGWGGGGVKKLRKIIEDMNYEVLEPVIRVRGQPSSEEEEDTRKLAKVIAERL